MFDGGGTAMAYARATLTPRQAEVIRLAALGFTMRETAVALGIAWHTARQHRREAYRRLGVYNATQAAVALYRQERAAAVARHSGEG